MLAISEGQIKMTSAAASCPLATRALSTERARRTRFASCSACAGSELAAGLIALIDSYRFLVGTPRPESLYPEAAADSTACAALAASTVSSLDRRPRARGEGPGRFGLKVGPRCACESSNTSGRTSILGWTPRGIGHEARIKARGLSTRRLT
jgi:hypothetical protein